MEALIDDLADIGQLLGQHINENLIAVIFWVIILSIPLWPLVFFFKKKISNRPINPAESKNMTSYGFKLLIIVAIGVLAYAAFILYALSKIS